MAVYDIEGSGRTGQTISTLESLTSRFNYTRDRLFVIDNNSCPATQKWLLKHDTLFSLITLQKNRGTAYAINRAHLQRKPGEMCVKMDNDVIIDYCGDWIAEMERVFERDPSIGIVGLKRKDANEVPWSKIEWFRSKLVMLPHESGQDWIVVEEVNDMLGTCQAYNPLLMDRIGYLYQPRLYGLDDVLYSFRSIRAGFRNALLPHIPIRHIDPGGGDYQKWKDREARIVLDQYENLKEGYISGQIPLYYDGAPNQ